MFQQYFAAIGLICCLFSCTKPAPTTPNNPVPPVTDTTVIVDTTTNGDTTHPSTRKTYLALGDSYTIGQSVPVLSRFPVQTVAKLNAQNILFDQPEIIAQTGWTTGNLLSAMASTPPLRSSYDIVTLLIGVNNQYQRRTQSEYREQFITLLEKAILLAGNKKRVIVLSIPDYSVTPFASGSNTAQIAAEIDAFNVINKNIAQQYEVNYIDITGYTRLAATDPSLIAADGLHPSGVEYEVWANLLVPVIRSALQ